MRGAIAALALALLLPVAAAAHPHGALDCSVTAQVQHGQVQTLTLRLVLDAASSAALHDRVQPAQAEPTRAASGFRSVLAGLFRQGGWMLQVRPPGVQGTVELSDPDAARWGMLPDGRLTVQVALQPVGTPLPADGLELRCQDSSWYWLPRFRSADQVHVEGATCAVDLDDWQRAADRARAMQAQAQRAGAPGADQMAPALSDDSSAGAALARLRC